MKTRSKEYTMVKKGNNYVKTREIAQLVHKKTVQAQASSYVDSDGRKVAQT
ncbi:MAG: hypothetical protein ACK5LT_05340 [Lachnospirales bacterium]